MEPEFGNDNYWTIHASFTDLTVSEGVIERLWAFPFRNTPDLHIVIALEITFSFFESKIQF